MNCELVFGSFCRKKAEFPFPRWLPNRTMSEQSQGTLSRLYFVPSSCHNSHQGELTNSLAHIFTQQKWDNLPFASLHSGEQTTTAQRERRRSEQPPPTDGVDCLERKFTTAQNLPLAPLHSGEKPTAQRDRRRRVTDVPD